MLSNVYDYLPIGTVVLLNNGNKKLMIFGIIQSNMDDKSESYDYIGVPYPEGNMGPDYQYLFHHKDIKEIYFRGFEDVERQALIANLAAHYNRTENE